MSVGERRAVAALGKIDFEFSGLIKRDTMHAAVGGANPIAVPSDRCPSSLADVGATKAFGNSAFESPALRPLLVIGGVGVIEVPTRWKNTRVTVDSRKVPVQSDHHGVDL